MAGARGCELLDYCGGSTSAATPSNLDGAARAETYQDQILRGPRAKGFRAWYRLSEPFESLPASNFTATRFLSESGDWSWPRKSVASKTMPGACSAVPEHEAIMPLKYPGKLYVDLVDAENSGWACSVSSGRKRCGDPIVINLV